MILESIYKSIVRATTDAIADIKATTGDQSIEYHPWESRADEAKLPQVPLIGVDGFQFEENKGLWVVRYGIGVSSYMDANLLHEIKILDRLHELTGEGKKIDLLNPTDGSLISELVVSAWHLSPMASSEYRNYRVISVELRRTGQS